MTITASPPFLAGFSPERSLQAHEATAPIGFGACFWKAAAALQLLAQGPDRPYWQHCHYAEGWLVINNASPDPDEPNPPSWEPHGFIVGPDTQVIDPIAALSLQRFGAEAINGNRWIPVYLHPAAALPPAEALPYGDGQEPDALALLPAFRSARDLWRDEAQLVALQLHNLEHGSPWKASRPGPENSWQSARQPWPSRLSPRPGRMSGSASGSPGPC